MTSAGSVKPRPLPFGANDLLVIVFFGLAAFCLRLVSFHRSVIDWDESLYFLMAEAWRAGHLPYTVLWDNKPIGIYAIFATCQAVFGDTIASMRMAAITAVTITAFCLYRLSLALEDNRFKAAKFPGLLCGILYLLCSMEDGGMAANTELFIAPFVCMGMLIAGLPASSEAPSGLARAYGAGLMLGLAIIVKYVAVFESAATALLLLIRLPSQRNIGGVLVMALVFLLGMSTPMAAVATLYAVAGHLDLFVSASLLSNLRRLDMPLSPAFALRAFRDHAEALFPLYSSAFLLLVYLAAKLASARESGGRRDISSAAWLCLWIGGAFIGTVSAKSFYPHYFLQPIPALCVACVWISGRLVGGRLLPRLLLSAMLLVQPALGAQSAIGATAAPLQPDGGGIGWLQDQPAQIAAALRPSLTGLSGTKLYVFDFEPILYSLTGSPPPTRYAFPSFMISRFLSRVAAIDAEQELGAILAKDPHFIVCSRLRHPTIANDNMDVYATLSRALAARYRVWRIFPSAIVYRLAADGGNGGINPSSAR